MDRKSVLELLEYIIFSINLIEERFLKIETSDDFIKDNEGLEKLDAISMRLQSIGEAIKNILKLNETILLQDTDKSYWSEIVRFRDILSHHYIDIDSEIVYDICNEDLAELKSKITKLISSNI